MVLRPRGDGSCWTKAIRGARLLVFITTTPSPWDNGRGTHLLLKDSHEGGRNVPVLGGKDECNINWFTKK